jgi:hypothetical protein
MFVNCLLQTPTNVTREISICRSTKNFLNCTKAQARHLRAPHRRRGESHNLRDPDLLAQEIVEALEVALEQFREIATNFGERVESLRKAR